MDQLLGKVSNSDPDESNCSDGVIVNKYGVRAVTVRLEGDAVQVIREGLISIDIAVVANWELALLKMANMIVSVIATLGFTIFLRLIPTPK